jgi:hypothetical protein
MRVDTACTGSYSFLPELIHAAFTQSSQARGGQTHKRAEEDRRTRVQRRTDVQGCRGGQMYKRAEEDRCTSVQRKIVKILVNSMNAGCRPS